MSLWNWFGMHGKVHSFWDREMGRSLCCCAEHPCLFCSHFSGFQSIRGVSLIRENTIILQVWWDFQGVKVKKKTFPIYPFFGGFSCQTMAFYITYGCTHSQNEKYVYLKLVYRQGYVPWTQFEVSNDQCNTSPDLKLHVTLVFMQGIEKGRNAGT